MSLKEEESKRVKDSVVQKVLSIKKSRIVYTVKEERYK